MKDKIQKSLDEVIGKELESLTSYATEAEREKTIENLTNLYKLRIEEAKIEQARCEKLDELEAKQTQFDQQAKERRTELILQACQIALTIGSWGMFSVWQHREQKFEMNGTPTTPIYRSLLSKIVPSLRK